MKQKRSSLHGIQLLCTYRYVTRFFVLLSLFSSGIIHTARAGLNTQQWLEDHHGYSLELVPGTGGTTGNPAEYVAAGTAIWSDKPTFVSWNFAHLDANGNVMQRRLSTQADFHYEYRVVDIVPLNQNLFSIIIQARNTFNNSYFMYVHCVDRTGADAGIFPYFKLYINNHQGPEGYDAMFPTHGYYAQNGNLYVCGYAAKTSEFGYGDPSNYYSNKISWLCKIDMVTPNGGVPLNTFYTWNTPNTSAVNGTDYDMPLRIVPGAYGNDFPLLVTGAMNNGFGLSAVYIGKFDANLTPLGQNGVYDYNWAYSVGHPNGSYGVDVRANVGGTEDIVILCNDFEERDYAQYHKRWGVIRLRYDLTAYPNTAMTHRLRNENYGEWATQFLELHTTENPPAGHIERVGDHIYVVGQKIERPCGSLPGGSLAPSTANVDPFISFVDIGDNLWELTPGAGYAPQPGAISSRNVYLSSKGTKSSRIDYIAGVFPYGSALEDVSRLYTFAALERYYDNPNAAPPVMANAAILAPVAQAGTIPSTQLQTRLLTLNASTGYSEDDCEKTVMDCNGNDLLPTTNVGSIDPLFLEINSEAFHETIFDYSIPSTVNCNTGFYKPSAIAGINPGETFAIYPNPATKDLNIQLAEVLSADDAFSFTLLEATGKKILVCNNAYAGSALIHIDLAGITPGVYFGIVELNGNKYSKKVVIQ